MADATAAVALNVLSGEKSTDVVNQKQLFEFFSAVKASAIANGTSAQFANPAALGGEALKSMRGALKQSAKVEKMFNDKNVVASAEKSAEQTSAQSPALHGGPAKEQLNASGKTETGVSATSMASIDELRIVADKFSEMMKFSASFTVVTSGASIAGQAVNSLTKGQ